MAINNVSLNSNIQNVTTTAKSMVEKESRSLQNQLLNKEQRLRSLSSDAEMTEAEKAKERQEVQKQIQELNRKLRLLQMEKEEESRKAAKEQEKKAREAEQKKTGESEADKEHAEEITMENPSVQNIQKVLASDSAVQQSRVQESVTTRQDAKIRVLETEIKADKLYGADTTAKREELSSLRRQKTFEIEPKEQEMKKPDYVMDSGAKIVIR